VGVQCIDQDLAAGTQCHGVVSNPKAIT
jgi:hypothetical protein